jgi:2'-hydroxyisoflavone reductase
LGGQTSHYLYVSSIAAYDAKGFAEPGLTEDAPLNPWDLSIRPYNRGKAESERRLNALLGGKLTVVRPGPIKGARDDTPDMLAWLRRAQAGGRHIGPGAGDDHVQHVDVKDVARFLILAIDRSLYGTYNLTGTPMTFREYLAHCNAATRSNAEFVWIPQAFLHEQGLDPAPWNSPTIPFYLGQFPTWHPERERRGIFQISSAKAFAAGWTQRPFAEMALDYLWTFDELGSDLKWTDELSPEAEARVLERWDHARTG